ncbi:hypothetical protein Gocc_0272 [Gaiella occulta]|uniref:Uncharacterized protein n=1 Tax=Gaiella occulta TaxID=1002870 RepID=A0A7M2Z2A0_9ACTN|nr:LmbU family transcriptional regulator [Gaiella occulta]RDI75853.1 hypothetical protein Gocc_0272 [Gaiella occulta]
MKATTSEQRYNGHEAAAQMHPSGGLTGTVDDSVPSGKEMRTIQTALHLAPELPFESWKRIGSRISIVQKSSAWWIGDWLNYGEAAYGKRYNEATAITGLDYQTLRNYAWVVSRFPVSRRRDTLSFHHHAEVAALDELDQETWLTRAAVFGWSRNELRRRIRSDRSTSGPDPPGPRVTVLLRVELDRYRRWLEAAAGDDLATWIAATLDQAALVVSLDTETSREAATFR